MTAEDREPGGAPRDPAATDSPAHADRTGAPHVAEPAAAAGTPAPAPRRRDRARILLTASAVGLVLLLVAVVVLSFQLRSAAQDEEARNAALSAARQSALNLTSIDQEDIEQDVGDVLDGATGEFRTDFAARADDLERLLTENEVDAEGKVLESALVRSDRNSATALVVVDSTVRNTATPDGRVNSYRMKLELEKVGDRWLTSVLEFVG